MAVCSRFCQKVDKVRSDYLPWGTNVKDAPDGRRTFQDKSPGILLTLGRIFTGTLGEFLTLGKYYAGEASSMDSMKAFKTLAPS